MNVGKINRRYAGRKFLDFYDLIQTKQETGTITPLSLKEP